MTRTKWLRRALLGGAALGVMATGAQADELAALKAQLEALQARVSEIETQPAPALPAGASMLTIRNGQLTSTQNLPTRKSDELYGDGEQGYTIAVTPTADMPAPVSEVTVSGNIRARLLYSDDQKRFLDDGDINEDYNGFDVNARGRLVVEGKTETAVGEVGGTIRLEGVYDNTHSDNENDGEDTDMDIAWGYWQMTPSFQLAGGYTDSTGSLQSGVDWQHNDDMTGGVNAFSNASNEQIRVTFTSGGFTLAVAVEDNDAECSGDSTCNAQFGADGDEEGSIPGFAGYAKFDTGSFVIAAAANWVQDERAGDGDTNECDGDCDDDWSAGIGINGKLGEMLSFTAAVAAGEGNSTGLANFSLSPGDDDQWWGVSGGVIFSFATAMSLQLGVGYAEVDYENLDSSSADDSQNSLDATVTLFWDPVDQLTLGIGVGFHDNIQQTVNESGLDPSDGCAKGGTADGCDDSYFVAGFGAYFRF